MLKLNRTNTIFSSTQNVFIFLQACHNADNPTVADAVTIATKTLAANVMPDVAMAARR